MKHYKIFLLLALLISTGTSIAAYPDLSIFDTWNPDSKRCELDYWQSEMCKSGYYHYVDEYGDSYCGQCPTTDYPTTSVDKNFRDITGCYIPAGNYSDESGQFQLTDNCHYS